MPVETFDIPKKDVAEAFDAWQKVHGRTDGGADELFRRRIQAAYRLRAPDAALPKLPGSRKTWSDWRKEPTGKTTTLDLMACQVLFDLTGVALIPAFKLDPRRNLTTAVKIAEQPTARLVGNAPDENGHETYAVSAPEISFRKSDAQTVTKDWLGATGKDGETVIGSVVFGLRDAAVKVTAEGEVQPNIKLLKPNRGDGASGVFFSHDGDGRWLVQADEGELHLHGMLELTDFANAKGAPEGEIEVSVEVDEAAIDTIFSASSDELCKDSKKSKARGHLLNKVLKLAMAERGGALVFAAATAKKA